MILKPIYTRETEALADLTIPPGATYLTGESVEERSGHWRDWSSSRDDVQVVDIIEQSRTAIRVRIANSTADIQLRSRKMLEAVVRSLGTEQLVLDITGLGHHVWAPIVRTAIEVSVPLRVIYAEPKEYRFSMNPTEGQIFDLSERIEGIAPLPGFAAFGRKADDDWYVPLLGFEGARGAYIYESVQPGRDAISPVIGVPGFRHEYPFHAYLGNKPWLEETRAWNRARYARANCPFSLFYVLADIGNTIDIDSGLTIAPVGTKPHALGAVLFHVVESHRRTEIVYDHPIRKPKRTHGVMMICAYDVSAFIDDWKSGRLQ
jgi:hypothetical protein